MSDPKEEGFGIVNRVEEFARQHAIMKAEMPMTSPDTPQPTEADKALAAMFIDSIARGISRHNLIALIALHAQQAREEDARLAADYVEGMDGYTPLCAANGIRVGAHRNLSLKDKADG